MPKVSKVTSEPIDAVPVDTRIHGAKSFTAHDMRIVAEDGQLWLSGKSEGNYRLTLLAVSQLYLKLLVPGWYIAALPATLAAQNLNHALKALRAHDDNVRFTLLMGAGDRDVKEVK